MKVRLLLSLCVCCVFILLQGCSKDHLTLAQYKLKHAPLVIANVLGSNMVIQRDKPFTIWGTSAPGNNITIKVSWNTSSFSGVTDAVGDWKVVIPAAPANADAQTIVCSTPSWPDITFNNILIGDVWICSGQSNMNMPLDSVGTGVGFIGVINYRAEIASANYSKIRSLRVLEDFENTPQTKLKRNVSWTVCSKTTAGAYSAIAYFFARKLYTTLKVPVGIVISAVGETGCQGWTSADTIHANPLLNAYYRDSIAMLYNGMIYPLGKLAVKGFLWDQGEANRDNKPISNYTVLNSAMINNWRTLFNQGQLPFYYVQMTPFARNYYNTTPYGDNPVADDYAKFREAQTNVRARMPGTGEAITLDINEITRIHPRNKKPIGERLALLALKNDYGQPVQTLGPQFLSYTVANNVATINYVSGTADGLSTANNAPLNQVFFVAGTDQIFRQATAVIVGNQVIVTAPIHTPLPIQAIRYAFTNFMVTNLQNSAGLPAEPFRTDDWSN